MGLIPQKFMRPFQDNIIDDCEISKDTKTLTCKRMLQNKDGTTTTLAEGVWESGSDCTPIRIKAKGKPEFIKSLEKDVLPSIISGCSRADKKPEDY